RQPPQDLGVSLRLARRAGRRDPRAQARHSAERRAVAERARRDEGTAGEDGRVLELRGFARVRLALGTGAHPRSAAAVLGRWCTGRGRPVQALRRDARPAARRAGRNEIVNFAFDWDLLGAPLLAGLLVAATHVVLGRRVLERGIIFIDI